jgi:hypothetical protein
VGLEKRVIRKINKIAFWIALLGPILPFAFIVLMAGSPSTTKEWAQIVLLYLVIALVVFLVTKRILSWFLSGFAFPITWFGFFLRTPKPDPRFSGEPVIPPGHALIYFYRSWEYLGIAKTPTLFVNNKHVTIIAAGTYYQFFTIPGEKEIRLKDSPSSALLEVDENQQYFVKVVSNGLSFKLQPMSAENGLAEIQFCSKSRYYEKKKDDELLQ